MKRERERDRERVKRENTGKYFQYIKVARDF